MAAMHHSEVCRIGKVHRETRTRQMYRDREDKTWEKNAAQTLDYFLVLLPSLPEVGLHSKLWVPRDSILIINFPLQ